jgi:transcriptional regulator with PAS, ATPase and Fis domain
MTVLITGESGVGKESFSKIIHELSYRKHGPFIAINCGAIPEGTIDSELFGHEKGAFTGASEARKGYFEVVNGGTIFLDEIGEMPLGTQARLLRVLEVGEFIRVGSSKVQKTEVRVVAATNVNLMEAVQNGKFREDLYYRLSTVPIFVPPLREREEDADLLFRKFAGDFSEKYRVAPIQLTPEAKQVLLSYRFPGNIRQLKNLTEQISVLEMDRSVDADTLRRYLPKESSFLPALVKAQAGSGAENYSERDLLYKVLFEMRRDITELKKLMHHVLEQEQDGSEVIEEHHNLFNNINSHYQELQDAPLRLQQAEENTERPAPPTFVNHESSGNDEEYELAKVEDISHETEDESLSLEKKEREMIVKALRKNNNKRKYAAQDLGISERTLYRKIKQYEIE